MTEFNSCVFLVHLWPRMLQITKKKISGHLTPGIGYSGTTVRRLHLSSSVETEGPVRWWYCTTGSYDVFFFFWLFYVHVWFYISILTHSLLTFSEWKCRPSRTMLRLKRNMDTFTFVQSVVDHLKLKEVDKNDK